MLCIDVVAGDEIKQLPQGVVVLDKHFKHLFSVIVVKIRSTQMHKSIRVCFLHSLFFLAQNRVDAILEVVDKRL